MLMSIIKYEAVSSFLTPKKYWNSRTFDYRTCRPVPNKIITHFPPTEDQSRNALVASDAPSRAPTPTPSPHPRRPTKNHIQNTYEPRMPL